MGRTLALLVAAPICAAAVSPTPAGAQAPPCLREIETAATALLFDLELELDRQNILSNDEWGTIRLALDGYTGFDRRVRSERCLRASHSQRARYDRWTAHHAQPVVDRARARLDSICSNFAGDTIRRARARRQRLVGAGKLDDARREADELAAALDREMVAECAPVRDLVRSARTELIDPMRDAARRAPKPPRVSRTSK